MSDRVIVFIDYQNAYRGARLAFHAPDDPHWMGQFHPLLLAQHLASVSGLDQALTQVRIYRSLPDARLDSKAYAAARRQLHAWSASPIVTVTTRPMRYPRGWPDRCQPGDRPREKGIEVALGLDFALMAADGDYDVGIIFSTNSELEPALEFVVAETDARAEVAAWLGPHRNRLSIEGRNLWCHWIREPICRQVADPTSYSKA